MTSSHLTRRMPPVRMAPRSLDRTHLRCSSDRTQPAKIFLGLLVVLEQNWVFARRLDREKLDYTLQDVGIDARSFSFFSRKLGEYFQIDLADLNFTALPTAASSSPSLMSLAEIISMRSPYVPEAPSR